MATIEQLTSALKNADRAGDTAGAKKLADAIRSMRGPPPAPVGQPANVAPGEFDARFQGKPPDAGVADAVMRGAADTASFGFGDEISAGVRSGFGLIGNYGEELAGARQRNADAQTNHPVASVVGNVAGAVPSMLIPGAGVARGANFAVKAGKAALAGAAAGGLYGAGSGDRLEDRLKGAITGIEVGGGLGIAGAAAGKAVGKIVGSRAGRAAVASTDAIRAKASALYDAAKQNGVVIRNNSFNQLVSRVNGAVRSAGFHPKIQTKAAAVLETLDQAKGLTPTLEEVDQLRQVAGAAARSTDPDERRVASLIIDHLDDWLGKLSPRDVLAGDMQKAVGQITEARKLWTVQAKGRLLDDLIYDVDGKAIPPAAIRQGFKALFKNKNRMRQFSAEEVDAIGRAARGATTEAIVKAIGSVLPSSTEHLGAVAIPGRIVQNLGGKIGAGAAGKASAVVRNEGQAPFNQAAAQIADRRTLQSLATAGRGATPSLLDLGKHRPLEITVTKGLATR